VPRRVTENERLDSEPKDDAEAATAAAATVITRKSDLTMRDCPTL